RLGVSSQTIVTGDITQIDLQDAQQSGLVEAQSILQDIRDIEFVYFKKIDVVRHRLVKAIIDAYERNG
ncbi:MAG: PhoH family protein, partial [Rhodothermaceae bacterium]|nr:PhoH family protein [Rhodothermaceae bacterium]